MLAVICDFEIDDAFDLVESKKGYKLACLNDTRCIILSENSTFEKNLVLAKKLGIDSILEISKNLALKENRSIVANELGIEYSGFMVSGELKYIKPLLSAAVSMTDQKEFFSLTERENEVLELVSEGFSNKQIAKKLFLSEKTVKNHLNNIFKKIGVTNRTNAALYVLKGKSRK